MPDREQAAIAATLLHGPDHLPAGLFAGEDDRILRGLRVHANNISHARLVALEESFPRTRAYLGEAEFNRLSRSFIEAGGAKGLPLAAIGRDFPDRLGDRCAADLARIEWAWLESHHSAEATALHLAHLADENEATLLGLPVRLHPATRVVELASGAAPLVDPGFASGASALLIARPDADVRLLALHPADQAALALAIKTAPLGNLIACLAEHHPDGGGAIAALIEAGAFERV